jgi:GNAT superfamily N-acetyltransferase
MRRGWPLGTAETCSSDTLPEVPVVRLFQPHDLPAIKGIIERLDAYFTPDVPEKIGLDVSSQYTWVLVEGDQVLGVSVVEKRSAEAAEILWMAVEPSWRGRGVGTQLLSYVIEALTAEGVSVVEVKTLDGSSDYEPYVATRAFWRSRGFVQIDRVDPLPGWQPGNPCAICVAALRATR